MSELSNAIIAAANAIRPQLPTAWRPDIAIILGSGLGAMADEVDAIAAIPYSIIRVKVQSHNDEQRAQRA